MAGMFPNAIDGGVSPDLVPFSYDPDIAPENTNALYYPDNCGVRLRPEVLNALISEIACVVDKAGLAYDGTNLCNLQEAITSMIAAKVPIFDVGSFNSINGVVPAGTYAQGVSGTLTTNTVINNTDPVRNKLIVIMSSSNRVFNQGANTATLGGQLEVSFNGSPFQIIAFAGSIGPGQDQNGGVGNLPSGFFYSIPPGGNVTVTMKLTWAINNGGTIGVGATIIQGVSNYLSIVN